ncbi:MAG: hypothetical protein GW886_11580 [Rhodobacterales bacterium]|nr:hypothetical protein [Rhodobacterales bacterium]NCT13557.1 hypothetical protein [Rhodobacterales bacterium]
MKTLTALAIGAAAPLTVATTAEADEAMRTAATSVVTPMMQEVAPGRGGEIFTACVIQNATEEEIAVIAMGAVTGPSPEIGALVSAILARPETLACAQSIIEG